MNDEKNEIRESFETFYAEWEKVIQAPEVQLSSRPQDYLNNEPYHRIVKLGRDVLPFVMEKLEQGVFFLNQAVVDITGIEMEEIIGKEKSFPSEQEKSILILKWWKVQKNK